MSMPTVATTKRTELADELLSLLPMNRVTSWSAAALAVENAVFDGIVQRLFELESFEQVDVLSLSRNYSPAGQRVTKVKFVRISQP